MQNDSVTFRSILNDSQLMKLVMYVFVLGQLLITNLVAQDIPIGSWRTHLTYHTAQQVAIAQDNIYCASENGLFYLNTTDNSLQTITKIDGLSDNGISDLAYSEVHDYLIIAYSNGNIDLLAEEEIINIRTILNSNRPNKNLYQVQVLGNLAIFATDFGGVELDLNTLTIKNVYENIGGTTSLAYSIASTSDSIYMATNLGVYGVSRTTGVNRQDFANWFPIPFTQATSVKAEYIAVFQDQLYIGISNDGVYRYENGIRTKLTVASGQAIQNLVTSNDRLYISTDNSVIEYQGAGNFATLTDPLISAPTDIQSDGQIWIADEEAGLIKYANGNSQNFFPTGTFSADAFRLIAYQDKILAVSGAYSRTLQPANNTAGFYQFDGTTWQNFTSENNAIEATVIPTLEDAIASVYDAANQVVYIASFGEGLLRWELSDDSFSKVSNAPTQLTDLALDRDGVLWATATSPNGVYQYDGTDWQLEKSPNSPLEIIVDDVDNKWVLLANGGVFVFDEKENQERLLTHNEGNGNLRGSRPFSLVKDIEGSIWVGTNDGITEFFDPFSIYNGTNGNFVRDLEGNVIIKDETTTALAVDGGNRKWIGTLSGGIWLYDENGELIVNFTAENSPLLSDEIFDIAIQPITGEVFIATSQGIISYRSTATTAATTHSEITIFPNPVRPEFGGVVSINGLVFEAQVKITDVSGRLVWQGESAGGTATWDTLDFNGRRVQTGVYLIFSTSDDGEDTMVGKVAVVK